MGAWQGHSFCAIANEHVKTSTNSASKDKRSALGAWREYMYTKVAALKPLVAKYFFANKNLTEKVFISF